jgi:hypothetical protein
MLLNLYQRYSVFKEPVGSEKQEARSRKRIPIPAYPRGANESRGVYRKVKRRMED